MKLRKFISMAITTAIVMTTAVIAVPTANAAAEKSGTSYSQNFGSAAASYSSTLTGLKSQGWYAADNTQLYTNVSGSVQPYKATGGKFGQIVADPTGASNYCLKVCSAGEFYGTVSGAVIKNYGYGTTFPGVEANQIVSGSWEIEFNFIPNVNSSTGALENDEFAFTINTSAGPNNLVSCDGTRVILGQFNPTTESTPFTAAIMNMTSLQKATYKVKVFLNIDQGYYSVDFWKGDTLMARRSPIALNSTDVKFLKFSALGINSACYVYVDNVSIKSAADSSSSLYAEGREKLIYSDDFSAYSGSTKANTAMTSETSGHSFFPPKLMPWRAYANTGYANYSVTDGVLRLGRQSESGTERSAMVYAIPGETILDATTERIRGMLNVRFRINPAEIKANNGFYLTLGALPSSSTQTTVFTMGPDGNNNPKIMYVDGRPATVLDAEHWYTVDMTIDVINRAIKFVVTDEADSTVKAEYVQAPASGNYVTPASIGEIMFRAGDNSGSYVFLDDVNISYVTPAPTVDTSEIVMTDNSDNVVSDLSDVTVAVGSITIPLGTIAGTVTASDFTFVDDSSNAVSFTGTLNSGSTYDFGDTFTITPSTLLESGKTYTLTALTTTESAYGSTLATPAVYTFTTTAAMQDLMSIKAVKVGGAAVSGLSDITAGSTINVETRYANNTESAITGVVIAAFYGTNKVIKTLIGNTSAAAGSYGTNTTALSVPAGLDMTAVRKVSVFLWDGFENIIPYCSEVSFE